MSKEKTQPGGPFGGATDLFGKEEGRRRSVDELNIKVQQTQEVLLDLERRKEELERQKRQLEELKRKQVEFEEGQALLIEQLTRGLALLERQAVELRRELEEVEEVRACFSEELRLLQSLDPGTWTPENLQQELGKALAIVDQARAVYSQAHSKVAVLRPGLVPKEVRRTAEENFQEGSSGLGFWDKVVSGFAYSLPGALFLSILILAWRFLGTSVK
jgi:chromosome segregation ATPase